MKQIEHVSGYHGETVLVFPEDSLNSYCAIYSGVCVCLVSASVHVSPTSVIIVVPSWSTLVIFLVNQQLMIMVIIFVFQGCLYIVTSSQVD